MPVAQRGMVLNDVSLHDENFWPSITQTSDGEVYLVDGARTSLVRVDGLTKIRRLPPMTIEVTADDLRRAQASTSCKARRSGRSSRAARRSRSRCARRRR